MSERKKIEITRIARRSGLEESFVEECIEKEWVWTEETDSLNDEDLARLNLIFDLRKCFGVNDEGIPLILHLVDQINSLKGRLHQAYEDLFPPKK